MNEEEWINAWKAEERIAHIHGWDFSHIRDRYTGDEEITGRQFYGISSRSCGCIAGRIPRFLPVARRRTME